MPQKLLKEKIIEILEPFIPDSPEFPDRDDCFDKTADQILEVMKKYDVRKTQIIKEKNRLLKEIEKLLNKFIPEKIQEDEFKKELEWLIYKYAPFLIESRLQELSQEIINFIKKSAKKK